MHTFACEEHDHRTEGRQPKVSRILRSSIIYLNYKINKIITHLYILYALPKSSSLKAITILLINQTLRVKNVYHFP